jgi:chitin disaccharide deacetylase
VSDRRLIVNADDFGRSPGISRGIVAAHQRGIVTSTTLMVNLPWSEGAAALLGTVPALAVGLHLNLCYGTPVAPDVPSLLEPGTTVFQRDETALRQAMRSEDVERELLAQLARFETLTGRLPDHIDSHRHLHLWPRVYEPLVRIARERDLPVRGYDGEHAARLRSAGVARSDRCLVDFYGAGQVTVDTLARIIRALPAGINELMCHPGFDDDALSDSSYRIEREAELRSLSDPGIRALLASEGVELVTFAAAQ